jgi:hypothetical protein
MTISTALLALATYSGEYNGEYDASGTYESLIDIAWRFYELGMMTSEVVGWLVLVTGVVGYLASQTNQERNQRYLGLIYGGVTSVLTVMIVGYTYEFVKFFMIGEVGDVDHDTVMYPELFLDVFKGPMHEIVALSGILSQTASVIGTVAISFGVALWGLSKHGSEFSARGEKTAYSGGWLLIFSVSERLMVGAGYVLFKAADLGAQA